MDSEKRKQSKNNGLRKAPTNPKKKQLIDSKKHQPMRKKSNCQRGTGKRHKLCQRVGKSRKMQKKKAKTKQKKSKNKGKPRKMQKKSKNKAKTKQKKSKNEGKCKNRKQKSNTNKPKKSTNLQGDVRKHQKQSTYHIMRYPQKHTETKQTCCKNALNTITPHHRKVCK